MAIHIGTSGWSYGHWKGPFYPAELSQEQYLAHYARHLSTVEINNAFYRLPETRALEHWRQTTPRDFVFAVKASRFVTHMKKLKDPQDSVPPFLDRVQALGAKLGPIVFQLPPRWHFNAERLTRFLASLDRRFRFAMELRDPSWLTPRAYDALERHGVAFCIYELDGRISPKEVTADFVYIRLHGPDGPYRGCYDRLTLSGWALACSAWAAHRKDVYCYFDNDENGYAVHNAMALRRMLTDG